MRSIISAAVVLAFPAAAEVPRSPEQDAAVAESQATASSAEIVVYGRRESERYRLPPEFRGSQPDTSSRWRSSINRDFACQNVGPYGCGAKGLPILTFGSDGKAQIGSKAKE